MRTIKFRGKRLDNGEWVVGHLGIMWNEWHIFGWDDTNTAYPVDPATIGQYTGMKDKAGQDIFEGDVLRIPQIPYFKGGNGYVLFIDDRISVKDGEESEWRLTWVVQESNDGIIGNIHDNPELITTE